MIPSPQAIACSALACAIGLASGTRAQFVVEPLTDTRSASVQIEVPVDCVATAYVLLEWFETLLPSRRPDQVRSRARSETSVRFGFTGERAEAVSFVDRLLVARIDGVELGDEVCDRLRDRALLRADDESMVLPGPRLRAAFGGPPLLARAGLQSLASLEPKELRLTLTDAMRARDGMRILVLGDVPAELGRREFAECAEPSRRASSERLLSLPEASVDEYVSAPFVIRTSQLQGGRAASFDPLTWVALQWIEADVRKRFPLRGRELEAAAPIFAWEPGTGVMHLIRRGEQRMIGGPEPADPAGEIDGFLADLAEGRLDAGSFDSAMRSVRRRLRASTADLRIPSLLHDHAERRLIAGVGRRLELPEVDPGVWSDPQLRDMVSDRVSVLARQDWRRARLDPPSDDLR